MADVGLKTNFNLQTENLYQTQPPQLITDSKLSSILDYLIFSNTSVTIHEVCDSPDNPRFDCNIIDYDSDVILVHGLSGDHNLQVGLTYLLTFGYKRKRAQLVSTFMETEGSVLKFKRPDAIELRNLRRNPRVVLNPDVVQAGLTVSISAYSGVGEVNITDAEVFEISQLGLSFFVSRADGLLLPGDKVNKFEVKINGSLVLSTEGLISRVDMERSSPRIPGSYQAVLLFKEISTKAQVVKRTSKRVPVIAEKPSYFSAEHPFFPGRKIEGQIVELSTSGLSCILEKTTFPIIPGMRFFNTTLQIPYCKARIITFEVAHVTFQSDGESNRFKLGGEFVDAPVELLKDISNYQEKIKGGLIQELTEDDLDLLWAFMFETNFIYQKKREQIQAQSLEIIRTYQRLLSSDSGIVRKIVFKENGEIKGHVSGIRFHDRTWMIQHLNATKSAQGSAAQAVMQSVSDFFYDSKIHKVNDVYFVMSFYRPDNLYPSILFGEIARRIADKEKAITHEFSFGVFAETADSSEKGNVGNDVIEIDSEAAISGLVNLLINQGRIMLLRSFGLGDPNPLEMKISNEYSKLGLYRERHIIHAKKDGNSVFGLIEMSSPGLNLSELTNSIFIFQKGRDPYTIQHLSEAVINVAYRSFYEAKSIVPVILTDVKNVTTRNAVWTKVYTYWCVSEPGFREFEKYSAEVLGDFRNLMRKSRGPE